MGLTEKLGIHPPSSGNFHRQHDDKSMDVWVQGSPFSNRWKLWWIMMIWGRPPWFPTRTTGGPLCSFLSMRLTKKHPKSHAVGGFNPSEKYENQLGLSFPIYAKIKAMFQTTNQYRIGFPYLYQIFSHPHFCSFIPRHPHQIPQKVLLNTHSLSHQYPIKSNKTIMISYDFPFNPSKVSRYYGKSHSKSQ